MLAMDISWSQAGQLHRQTSFSCLEADYQLEIALERLHLIRVHATAGVA
jgi:hypothetical protein